jgi:hypothetical protein
VGPAQKINRLANDGSIPNGGRSGGHKKIAGVGARSWFVLAQEKDRPEGTSRNMCLRACLGFPGKNS